MNRRTSHQRIAGARYPAPVRLFTVVSLGAGLVLGASVPAQAAEPDPEDFAEDLYAGLLLGEGAGTFPVDIEFEVMLDAEMFDIPEEVEIWALSTEGDATLLGEGETVSEVYQNPGSPSYPEFEVELIEVTLPSSEVPASDWYAFAAVDPHTDDLITWTVYPVELEEDPKEFSNPPSSIWPIPDHGENTEPTSDAPTLDALTEETYGLVSILRDAPVIPVDEDFTVEVETSLADVDLWLLPPGGEEAIFLPADMVETDPFPQWGTRVSSGDVEYNGIYGLVATNESDGLIGWAPFGLSIDGESLQPGDPGVHESDASYSDRSIWPIPDSVPGPDGDPAEEETAEPEDEQTQSPEPPTGEPEPEGTDESGPAEQEETADADEGINWVVLGLAVTGGALIIGGIAYLIGSRRST